MTDIRDRLRQRAEQWAADDPERDGTLDHDAADEIERLRSLIIEWAEADREFNATDLPDVARRYVAAMDALREEARQ